MPNDRPMTSRSGAIAQAAPASQNRSGGPGRRKAGAEGQRRGGVREDGRHRRLRAEDQVQVEQIRVRRPVTMRSPDAARKPLASLSASARSGSRPAPRPRTTVAASTSAPAASVGPSVPSVPAASTASPSPAEMSSAAASASSWQRPPRPAPRTVTVVSPAAIRQLPGGMPRARMTRSRAT
jgi:hypothetical protein